MMCVHQWFCFPCRPIFRSHNHNVFMSVSVTLCLVVVCVRAVRSASRKYPTVELEECSGRIAPPSLRHICDHNDVCAFVVATHNATHSIEHETQQNRNERTRLAHSFKIGMCGKCGDPDKETTVSTGMHKNE